MPAIQAQGEGYIGIAGVLAFGASFARPSWDISENERNSFPETEAALLSKITVPLKIEAHLAPEDPRRFDLEQQQGPKGFSRHRQEPSPELIV